MFNSQSSSTPPLLRMAHVMAFTHYLDKWGAPGGRYLAREGLPVLCEEPDHFAPLIRIWSFFDHAASQHDPMLGWQVGKHTGDHGLNHALLCKLESAPTLLRAFEMFAEMIKVEASDLELGIYERIEDILFYTRYNGLANRPGYHQSQSYQLGIVIDLVRHFIGGEWLPKEIGIQAKSCYGQVEEHFPADRVLYEQPIGYIAIPRSILHRKPPRTLQDDRPMADATSVVSFDFLGTLRALIKSYLPDGYPSASFAATLMDVSERTLARRLQASGYTYKKLIDEVRFEQAKALLEETDAHLQDIAHAVGCEDQGNFTRLFRRLGGITPGEFRRINLQQ